MEITAISRSVRISPRKVRLVADAIRNRPIEDALHALSATERRGAGPIAKTLQSAVSNAVNNAKLDRETLRVLRINVTEGAALKRFHPSTRGRIHPYKRRSSHITVVLADDKKQTVKNNPLKEGQK